MLHALKYKGYTIGKTSLQCIRREQRLWRRLSIFDRAQIEEQLQEAIKEELDKGSIEGYGRRLLYHHFRTIGFIATRYKIFPLSFLIYTNYILLGLLSSILLRNLI